MKIRSHLASKRENGEYTGAYVSYGFLKDEEDRNKLVVDPVAGQNVKRIFCWKMEGMSNGRIAEKLNALGIPAPADYKRSLGIRYKSGFQKYFYSSWSPAAVGRILNNPLCKGMVVQGKQERINHKVKKMTAKPEAEQNKFRQEDLALIGDMQFGTMQGLLEKDTRVSLGRESAYPFSGLLFCPDCGRQMIRRKVSRGGRENIFYICKTYNVEKNCTRHSIKEQELFSIVRETVQIQLRFSMAEAEIRRAAGAAVCRLKSGLQEDGSRMGGGYLAEGDCFTEGKCSAAEGRFRESDGFSEDGYLSGNGGSSIGVVRDCPKEGLEKELEESEEILSGLDTDKAEGILSEEEYWEMKEFYIGRCRAVKRQMEERKNTAVKSRAAAEEAKKWLEGLASPSPGHGILDGDGIFFRGLLVTLFEKIWVYEGKQVEFVLRYRDGM